MRLAGGIQDAIREVFSANQYAMKIAFRTTIGYVSPIIILINFPKPGKPMEDPNLDIIVISFGC